MRFRKFFPVLKKGTYFCSTLTGSPVLGFRPKRSSLFFDEKAPNPRNSTRLPVAIASVISSKTVDYSKHWQDRLRTAIDLNPIDLELVFANNIYSIRIWNVANVNEPNIMELFNQYTDDDIDLFCAEDLLRKAEDFLRKKRNKLLVESDYLAMPDYPHPNETTRQALLTYRQQLRNLPRNSTPQLDIDDKLINVTSPTLLK